MRVKGALQLSFLILCLCEVHSAHPPDEPSSSQGADKVPVYQVRMLSLGLSYLLQEVEKNAKQVEQWGEQVAAELDEATKSLESLHKHRLQEGQTHKQVRNDVQVLSASGDRVWRAVKDLQRGLEDLDTEQGVMQRRMNQILQRLKNLTQPSSGTQTQRSVSTMKIITNKRTGQLSSLTSEAAARHRQIVRGLQHNNYLEKQVSERLPAALRSDSDFV